MSLVSFCDQYSEYSTYIYCRDLKTLKADSRILNPSRKYTHHTQIVNDVQYHPISKNFIGSVSDDQTLQIVDVRHSETAKAAVVAKRGHLDAINALAFNPNSDASERNQNLRTHFS